MKFRKGLVFGLGLALSLQSVVVFANDVSSVATASTPTATVTIEGTTEEPVAEAPVAEAPVVEEPVVEEPVVEEPVVEEPVVEEPVVEEPVVEEPVVVEPVVVEPVVEEPVVEEPVVVEPVVEILDNQVPLADVLVPEVKANATLLINHKLISDEGEIIIQEEIKDLVAGTTVDIAEYVHEDEYVKAVNGTGTIELVEGKNEIIIEYKDLYDSSVEENSSDTTEEVYDGELMR